VEAFVLPFARLLPVPPRLKIVDVGAAASPSGTAYASLLSSFPCDVVGFEPIEAECAKLNALALPGHRYLPYAIADGTRRTFYECQSSECSSLFEPDTALAEKFQSLDEPLRVVGSRELDTKRLDDLPDTVGADFLKLDVQGAELLVLEGAVARLAHILVVHVEVEFLPLYKRQPLFADIDARLRAHGFAFHTMKPFGRTFKPVLVNNDIHALLNQLIWADAIYVCDFMRFDALLPESLLKIAAIVHENYRSFDLAAHALAAHDRQTGADLQRRYLENLSQPGR
jgi:FkbM family methyltransferase